MVKHQKISLDEAKERLRGALTRLEDAVEKRIGEAEEKLNASDIAKTEKELSHLREENKNLQTLLGKQKERYAVLKDTSEKAIKRIDLLTGELESLLDKKQAS